ncbi:hypothetical protein PGB90_006836 [Kerria lacca]
MNSDKIRVIDGHAIKECNIEEFWSMFDGSGDDGLDSNSDDDETVKPTCVQDILEPEPDITTALDVQIDEILTSSVDNIEALLNHFDTLEQRTAPINGSKLNLLSNFLSW